jgi:transcriptional regulator with XRE-family HTH domain
MLARGLTFWLLCQKWVNRALMKVNSDSIAERIKMVRAALNLSQREFAKGVFVSQSYFCDIEVGNREISERIVHLISVIYKVNKEWLKTGKGAMFSSSMTEVKLEHLAGVFAELDELLQDYLIKQANELLEIQKTKMSKPDVSQ